MEKRYRVTLTESERDDLRKLVSVGKAAAQKLVRARILWLADQAEDVSSKSDPALRARGRDGSHGLHPSFAPLGFTGSVMRPGTG
jgi:hypothetical protein